MGSGPGPSPPRGRGPALLDVLFFLGHAAAVLLGLATRVPGTGLPLVAPAAGVAVVWVLWSASRGRGTWHVGALVGGSTVLAGVATGGSTAMAVAVGVGSAVQPLAAHAVLTRLRPHVERLRQTTDLVAVGIASALGAVAAAAVVAPAGTLLLDQQLGSAGLLWLVRGAGSSAVVVAVALVLGDRGPRPRQPGAGRVEAVLCHAAVGVSYAVVFGVHLDLPLAWAVLPVAVWAGARLPTRTVAVHALLASTAVVLGTSTGSGPFADRAATTQVLLVSAFLLVLAFLMLLLALGREEHAAVAADLVTRTAQLQRSEEHYRLVAEHAGDAIGRVGPDGSVLWTSPATARVFGLSAEHLRSTSRAGVVHPDDVDAVARTTDEVFAGGRSGATVRFRVPQPDGSTRWMESHLSAVPDADGRVAEVVTLARDVTRQVEMEEQVARDHRAAELARAQLVEAFDASPDAFLVSRLERDADGRVVAAVLETINLAGCLADGRRAQDLVGRDLRALFPAGEGLGLWGSVLDAASSGRPEHLRLDAGQTRSGAVLDCTHVLLPGDRLLSSWRDVTEQVRREQLLTDAHSETARVHVVLQTAIDAMQDAFLVQQVERDEARPGSDGRGAVVGVRTLLGNAAAAHRFGVAGEALLGVDLRELVPEAVTGGLWERLLTAVGTSAPQHLRMHHSDDGGTWQWSEDLTLAPCADDLVVTLLRDATQEEHRLRDITQDRESAVHAAMHDALTGLPNRTGLLRRLTGALAACEPGHRVAVVFVDLDGFKAVNDTHGHGAGDEVLCAVAQRLGGLVRQHDTAARLSGDEFVLVLGQLPEDWEREAFVDRAREQLGRPLLLRRGAGAVQLRPRASLGLVLTDPHDGTTSPSALDLLALADAQMYEEKRDRRVVRAG